MAQTPQTTQPGAPAQKSEGLEWVFRSLAPKGQEQAWADHYKANKNAWNLGIGAGLGLTTAALANGAANAFGGNSNNNNGGGGSGWGWLAPMALGAAGVWAWNKWGGQLTNLLDKKMKAANDVADANAFWAGVYNKGTNAIKNLPRNIYKAQDNLAQRNINLMTGSGWVTDAQRDKTAQNTVYAPITNDGVMKANRERYERQYKRQNPSASAEDATKWATQQQQQIAAQRRP